MTTFKRDTLNESNSCPAWDAFDRAPMTYTGCGNVEGAINLTAGETLVVDGELGTYTINSVVSYALESNADPIAAYERAVSNGHETHWINANASVLTSHDRAKEKMIVVTIGQLVVFEGRTFTIERAANRNLRLAPVSE